MLSKTRSRTKKGPESSTSNRSRDSDFRPGRNSTVPSDVSDKFRVAPEATSETAFKKFLPKALSSKKKQKEREQEFNEREEAARGRRIADRGILRNDTASSGLGTDGDAHYEGYMDDSEPES